MKPGRNDPCPCGSGKKYKKCCLLAEQTSILSLTSRLLRDTADKIPQLLMPYAGEVYGEGCVFDAWDDFWAGRPQEDFHSDTPWLELFGMWFMYQWYPDDDLNPDAVYPCDHTVAAHFLRLRGRTLDAPTMRYLEHARKEPLSFWQVEASEPGEGVLLRDLLLDRERLVRDRSASARLHKGDMVLAQVVGQDDEYIVSAMGPYSLPSARFRGPITELVAAHQRHVHSAIDLLKLDVEFIWFYQDCVDALLDPPEPELRNSDGEKLTWTQSHFRFHERSRALLGAKLNSMRNIDFHATTEGEDEYGWSITNKQGPLENTLKGRLLLGGNYLRTECNSRSRDRRLRARLIKNLGEWITYDETRYDDFDADGLSSLEASPALDLDQMPEDTRQAVQEVLEQQYLRWVDQKIPALKNLTPKEAVQSTRGREQVKDLIDDWENMQLRMPDAQFAFDFNKLRKLLGLEED